MYSLIESIYTTVSCICCDVVSTIVFHGSISILEDFFLTAELKHSGLLELYTIRPLWPHSILRRPRPRIIFGSAAVPVLFATTWYIRPWAVASEKMKSFSPINKTHGNPIRVKRAQAAHNDNNNNDNTRAGIPRPGPFPIRFKSDV